MNNKKVGFIGAGYMGYGMAMNLIKHFDLFVIAHKNRKPIDKLVKEGATEVSSYNEFFEQKSTQQKGKVVPEAVKEVANLIESFDFAGKNSFETNRDFKLALQQRVKDEAKKAGVDVEIVHSPATQIPADADIVVTHQGLAGVAKSAAPENSVLIQYVMFMNDPSLNKLIKDLSEGNTITSS